MTAEQRPKLWLAQARRTQTDGLPPTLDWYGRHHSARSASVPEPETSDAARRFPRILIWSGQGALGVFALVGVVSVVVHLASSLSSPSSAPSPPAAAAAGGASVEPATVTRATDLRAPDNAANLGAFYEGERAAAEQALQAQLSDATDLRFNGVRTVLRTEEGESRVDFCGEVNSRNPAGDYQGFQRFISSKQGADIERSMTPGEFSQDWLRRCSGAEGPRIWR